MKVHAFASLSHYGRHLRPVWEALPEEYRGEFCTDAVHVPPGPVIVAGWADAHRMAARDLIYLEHGAGQIYRDSGEQARHYSGGQSVAFESVRLFLCPSARVAAAWRATYPNTPSAVIGCPALDQYLPDPPQPHERTLAISFHYDAHRVCPEARSAFPHYRDQLPATIERLRRSGWRIMGHGHPRAIELKPYWAGLNVQWGEVDDVLRFATVLAIDNSSLLYEMAALGRPTIALNAPWYRPEVEHGLRFWSHIPDVMIDGDVGSLDNAVMGHEPTDDPEHRLTVARDVYAHLDGRASERAAAAILDTLT